MNNYKINLKNLLTGKSVTENPQYPLFNHESYKIQVSLNDESYASSYRRSARWDFGDGTVIEGPSAVHYYEVPGQYTISCSLYSLNRKPAENVVEPIQVVVKEVVPTEISFIDTGAWFNKKNDFCKNNRLGEMQITAGSEIASDPAISAFQRNTEQTQHRQNYFEICNETNYHLKRYWTFLQEEPSYYFNGEYVKTILKPTQTYTPEYIPLYGRFVCSGENINLEAYVVVPASNEIYKKCKLAPYNTSDLKGSRVKNFEIIRKDKMSELPKGCTKIGKIAIANIWFKSDYAGSCELLFEIKKDTLQAASQKSSVENYLNIPPLGFKLDLPPRPSHSGYKYAVSSNGIFSGNSDNIVDDFLSHNFYKDYKVEGYWAHYIENDELNGEKSYNIIKYENTDLLYNTLATATKSDNTGCEIRLKDVGEFYYFYEFIPYESNFNIFMNSLELNIRLYTHGKLVDLDTLVLPSEKISNEDIDRLLSAYMQHPMYDSAENAKKFFKSIFENKNILSYLVSKGNNFIDDNVNHKTCYVDKLLSTLEMLDNSVSRYDIAAFQKVNQLRDLTRILTMNYSHLFGTVLEKEYDIEINAVSKGKNVGEKINADDTIFCNENYEIIGFRKGSSIYQLAKPSNFIVVKDNFTSKTHLVSFYDVQSYEFEEFADQSEEWKVKNAEFISQVKHAYHIANYDNSWAWNLNLSKEIQDLANRGRAIDSCYNFFIFIPTVDKHRKYNFVDEDTIPLSDENPNEQISVEEWSRDFGFTYDCLMKVLIENLK